MRVVFEKSPLPNTRFVAIFSDGDRTLSTHFGRGEYYADHGDMQRRERWIARHSHEDWNNPQDPRTLCRWVLSECASLEVAQRRFAERFGLELE